LTQELGPLLLIQANKERVQESLKPKRRTNMKKLKTFESTPFESIMSRRKFIASTGLVAASGILTGSAIASVSKKIETSSAIAPPLPWPWVKLDPQEAGQRAFRNYHEKGG
jgi:hypothetical protein